MKRKTILSAAVSSVLLLGGCSVYMESTRPTPINLNQFHLGESRDTVIERIGPPGAQMKESDGAQCDLYRLYTKGYGALGKGSIAFGEGLADVMTLGLAEIVLSPTEAATKNAKHPINFCYKNEKLVRIERPHS